MFCLDLLPAQMQFAVILALNVPELLPWFYGGARSKFAFTIRPKRTGDSLERCCSFNVAALERSVETIDILE